MAIIKVYFYENSYQFKAEVVEDCDVTTIKVNVLRVLLAQFRYRNDGESLWCDVKVDGKPHGRYEFNPTKKNVDFFIFWKHSNMVGNGWFSKRSRVIGETATHYTVVYDEKTGQTSEVSKDLLL
jgi:hypothetical protein